MRDAAFNNTRRRSALGRDSLNQAVRITLFARKRAPTIFVGGLTIMSQPRHA
jgi:hypothetical protein